ncbi:YbfB/YjiJ family MFS transporter [Ferrimonas sp. YFM]|uniref:YbfB/YjiJ family MFS transporter n=1 Tax=Ferrimonas sp. YFM TaxID=3028878 RepID=UPI00257423B3|nr:YbfB/YjiJ family MFS transporter [Ferrimonas sp. YFM]BDY05402.1 MFS transporter [Ferrimonas sp. YFM]
MLKRKELTPLWLGICSTFAGIGLSRLAFSSIQPELIEQLWFSADSATLLGAINLAGYLAGAVLCSWIFRTLAPRHALPVSYLLITLSFLLCALPGPFYWFALWRFISGASGAVLMILGPAMALAVTSKASRPKLGTLMFSGIGLGAALSGIILPSFLSFGLTSIWLMLAVLTLVTGSLASYCLSALRGKESPHNCAHSPVAHDPKRVSLIILAYSLAAAGFVPHTLFWVDYLSREKELGIFIASGQWFLFGVGAMLGSLLAYLGSQRFGCGNSLSLAFVVKSLAVLLALLAEAPVARGLSSTLVGAMIPCITGLTAARLSEVVDASQYPKFWRRATLSFALTQATAGYLLSQLYQVQGSYTSLFLIGAGLLCVSAAAAISSQQNSPIRIRYVSK